MAEPAPQQAKAEEQQYVLKVNERNQAVELPVYKVCGSASRNPHIRAFWAAATSYFLAFFGWFAFTGLEVPYVANSMGICENQVYPPLEYPRRPAYLKFKNLNTMLPYCQYGANAKSNPTDCNPIPPAIAALPLCGNSSASQPAGVCVTPDQLQVYRPEVLTNCVCTAGTSCAGHLTDASTAASASTIAARVGMGWALERFGMVNTQCFLVFFGSACVAAGALVNSVWNYILVRFLIGVVGATFVTNQFWNSYMFAPNIIGTANAAAAGWGNLGGGVTTSWMPGVMVGPMVEAGMEANLAWRLAMLYPALLLFLCGVGMKLLCWDTPTHRRLRTEDLYRSAPAGLRSYMLVLKDPRVWLMVFQYGACFGTEITMYNQLPRHFSQYFQMRAKDASLMASIFGLTNIFSRPTGGILSDMCYKRWGMRGRVWLQFIILFGEGAFLMAFGLYDNTMPVAGAAILLFLFSLCCEMACGTCFGIAPFMIPEYKSIVTAVVGAGGSLGSVMTNAIFYKQINDDLLPYLVHGCYVMFFALLTPAYYWPQHGGTFWAPAVQEEVVAEPSKAQPEEKAAKALDGESETGVEGSISVADLEFSSECASKSDGRE